MKEVTYEQFSHMKNGILVDVRSPLEFAEGSVPGAVNIPLFTNTERQEVGTLYKQAGANAAKWRAMEIVSPKLPAILKEIRQLSEQKLQPVVYCWRGGMRSGSVATFLQFAGMPATRLIGGYKAYRQYILDRMPELIPPKAVVLHGMTGSGKTEILKLLESRGYPVLDLEEIADHRGSVFGQVGTGTGHNQKTFDSLLFAGLEKLKDSPYFIMEAESKRIGRALQPEMLLDKKINGIHIHIDTSNSARIDRIYKEYVIPFQDEHWFHEKVVEGLMKIEKRLKNREVNRLLHENAEHKDYQEIIRLLLDYYYDSRYQFKRTDYIGEFFHVPGDDVDKAAEKIAEKLELLNGNFSISS
ncbi:tRNA 2-selenouridine(34) synthase MnmH [Bacillus canaveralius]|uniref:tRNA 2-selenouridine(34) synthase MnmH n=1 Tax=Bacillus canaveralius TaxID=1403243 RepID=A0A2N5GG68_9BACI|nr:MULTISPECIES: tRNA 2-selenouridine(34) synthase MnmH [Bacillus]PLR79759.1 tRNA 2-selenouridine(34) synthase MnmH [Bacillus canaveralius]PLR81696.1 tRNA 2-selenouridine(34) synthase MnmH [Bacillus sp. V33-4]PLR93169.1 tRNA 2-selenouridine(34) synthase MnmH [Bacillus canaveralius]RSK52686.1 tRNA 2-selenouridine(34) synthase MnmH [Bacillus canaveralius]